MAYFSLMYSISYRLPYNTKIPLALYVYVFPLPS